MFCTVLISAAQEISAEATLTKDDIQLALGDWTGSLTYIDYQSNEPYTMPANMEVKPGKNEMELILYRIYPNEPQANGKGKLKITQNGKMLNKEPVKFKEVLSDGVKIITEYQGKDNNQNALIRNTYVIRQNELIIRKDVRFENSPDWLKRNQFTFNR
jgi:hypothetical protein